MKYVSTPDFPLDDDNVTPMGVIISISKVGMHGRISLETC